MKQTPLAFAIFAAALVVMLSTGISRTFGFFLIPITETLNLSRESFSLAAALSQLIYGLPLVGILADRFGPRKVLGLGGVIYIFSLLLMSRVMSTSGLLLSMGVLTGIALSATTYVVVLGAVAQLVPEERRSSSFGIITMAGSSGMFVMPPIVQFLIATFGWRLALAALAIVPLIIIGLAFGLPASPGTSDIGSRKTESDEPFIKLLTRAGQHQGYVLLFIGFFVCGFHVAFIGTHLPAFLSDNGMPAYVAIGALSLIGVFNMIGSSGFGFLGDRYRKKYLLSGIYLGRAIVIALFIFFPITATTTFVFSGAIGFLWLATVPLTSGTVAQIFGTRYLSTLYGVVFFGHQIGAFLGVWLGGRLYDTTGTYDIVWYLGIGLGVLAFFVHLPITDKPAPQIAVEKVLS